MGSFTLVLALMLVPGSALAADEAGIVASYLEEAIPIAPSDVLWKRAREYTVDLLPQMLIPPHGGGAVTNVSVRALHDAQQIAFRLEWADATPNREVGVDRFRDSIAVGFPSRHTDRVPSPFMGDPDNPVNIWQWTADFDANARGQGGFAERYPHTEGVWYFPQDYAVTRQVHAWRGTEPVIQLVASGFGTLERKDSQTVLALSRYTEGRWRVVLRRGLATGNPGETLFRAGDKTHMIVAIWDGEKKDVNGKKSVTMMWTPLTLESTLAGGR